MDCMSKSYSRLKDEVILGERRLLKVFIIKTKVLGFCVHVQHPHKVNFNKPVNYINSEHIKPNILYRHCTKIMVLIL